MIAQLKEDLRQHGHTWFSTVLAVVIGMQLLRVLFLSLVGFLRDSRGMSSLDLAPIAIGVFTLGLLAGVLNRLTGTRTALWISAGGLALIRAVEQFVTAPQMELYLSITGVVLFLIYIPIALGVARARDKGLHFAAAFILGLAFDSAIFVGAKTLDLSWQNGFIPSGIVLVLAGSLLWALSGETADAPAATDGSWLANLGLVALGPWLMLNLLVFQSPATAASLTGWHTPAAGALILAGDALGLWWGLNVASKPRRAGFTFLVGVLLLLALLPGNEGSGTVFVLWLLAGNVLSLMLFALIIQHSAGIKGKQGLLATTVTHGIGQILFVLVTFVYYASYDINFGIRSGALLPGAAGLIALLAALSRLGKSGQDKVEASPGSSPVCLATALLVVPLVLAFTWKQPQAITPPSDMRSVRVMSYNLHGAVNTDGRLDPEALAQVIEASGADIVGLQEVSRGWLIWGDLDMLEWLSQRLGMNYVWNPTADAEWGNAFLTRLPILSAETRPMPTEDLLLRRGFIVSEIDLGGATLNVIVTHFNQVESMDQERQIEASAILDAWGGKEATIFMGDLNTHPDTAPIRILVDNGFVDISAEIGTPPTYTYYAVDPYEQIDYIFASPDLGFHNFEIPRSTASDHLPMVVTIDVP